jgi:hypothetical protein
MQKLSLTPPPTALPCIFPTIIFEQVRMALITLAKPEKKFLPDSKSSICNNSSNDAPAQKVFP